MLLYNTPNLPAQIIAGDHLTTTCRFVPEHNIIASTLVLLGPSRLEVNGVILGDEATFTLTTTRTSVLLPGSYAVYLILSTGNGMRSTSILPALQISPDPMTTASQISHAEKMLAAIEQVLEGRVTDDVQQLSIAGRSITKIPVDELLALRAQYAKEVADLRALAGGNRRQRIQTVRTSFNRA